MMIALWALINRAEKIKTFGKQLECNSELLLKVSWFDKLKSHKGR